MKTLNIRLFFYSILLCTMALQAQVANQSISYGADQTGLVNFGDIDALDGVSKFTFEAWVKVATWQTNSTIFTKRLDNNNKIGIQLGNSANGQLFFMVANTGNTYLSANTSLNDGKWHHVALVYDGTQGTSNDRIMAYVDGISVSNFYNGTIPTSTPTTNVNFVLGSNFTGALDEVRLWDIPLTQAQLDYKNTITSIHPLYANLLNYWKLDKTAPNTVYDVKGSINGLITGNANKQVVTDNAIFKYRIVSAYVRPQFHQLGRVKDEYLRNNNDIIYFTAQPYDDGTLFFDNPINDATFINASYLSSFSGRNGVADITTAGSLNCGKDLMRTATGGINKFTFTAWVYIDTWVTGSTIFNIRTNDNNKISIELGNEANGELLFQVANGSNAYLSANTTVTAGVWNHIAMVFDGAQATATNRIKGYVNASQVVTSSTGTFPTLTPDIREDFILGTNFDGKLDEVSVTDLALTSGTINSIKNSGIIIDSWNETFTRAYLNFDDGTNPGKDSVTWKIYFDQLIATFNGYNGANLRIGFHKGNWENMIANPTARTNFANSLNAFLIQYPEVKGIDLDFEWCYSGTCWSNYSALIELINSTIATSKIFSVSLHPVAYSISANAIAAVDFISCQSYGPSPSRFSRAEFLSNMTTFLNHGIPKEKLVMGLPYYGVKTVGGGGALAYDDFIAVYPNLDPALDEVNLNGVSMTFNGQETIAYKSNHIVEQELGGVMAWDSATDIDYDQTLCLLRATNSKINANVEIPIAIDDSSLSVNDTFLAGSQKSLKVFPNPTQNGINVLFNEQDSGKLKVFSLLGQTVYESKLSNRKAIYLDLKHLKSGIYLVKFSSERTGVNHLNKIIVE